MSRFIRIPRKFTGFFVLFAMLHWLFLPTGVREKKVFAEENQPLTESEIKDLGNKDPLFFEANQGQLDNRVKFSAKGSGYKLFLTSSEAVYVIPERNAEDAQEQKSKLENPSLQTPKSSRAVAVWMKLSGANQNSEAVGIDELAGKHNYFKGSDESKWQSDVPLYEKARFDNVYPGVDLEWHSNEAGSIEYDFKVSPNVSTRQIEWQIDGADKVTVEADGSLLISTPFGELKQNAPVTFQEIDGLRSAVESRFEQRGETSVGFTVGEYDRSKPLTIDPASDLVYSTFLGGDSDDIGYAVATTTHDPSVYVTGYTFSTTFPTTVGVFNPDNAGSSDVFVTKFNEDASALVYSTYIGGSGADVGFGVAVDSQGNAYVTGYTDNSGTPFPTTINAPYPNNGGGFDGFVTKLNATGSALVHSTYLGGTGDDRGVGIVVKSNNAYILGNTGSSNFPTTPGAFDTNNSNNYDAFVAKLASNGASLEYSTFIGGVTPNDATGIAVDGAGNAFICGYSYAGDYPITPGAFQTTVTGSGADLVVTKLNAAGSALIYSTFIGGDGIDFAYAIAIDAAGSAYITGLTYASSMIPFPITPGAFDGTHDGSGESFVTKLNASGSALVYSTFLGGDGHDEGKAIAVNAAGNAFVTGHTASSSYPTTAGAFDTTYNGSTDVFLTKLTATGSALIFSTLIGGTSLDKGHGIALNSSSDAFISGFTFTGTIDFPTTGGAFQTQRNSIADAFVSKFAATPNVPIARAPFDFDGDNKTDIGIFRPAVGEWWIQRSSNALTFATQFGSSTDKIAPGDYTGDGKTDIAFFRPSIGFWFVLRSDDFSFYSFPFGNSSDIPAPADYDGDDKTDAAVFRTTDSTWYISKSTGGTHIQQFGQSGDIPVTSDYDGDGKSDLAIYRTALGEWWINRSSAGLIAFQFGNSTDKPVPGDYTGDGKSDVVFKRAEAGFNWFVLRSEDSSFYSFPFGTATDIPAPGDYDGDGKFDAAVFRPSNSTWYVERSTAGSFAQTFGQNGDRPVPNAFVP